MKYQVSFFRENLISSHVKITCYLHMWKCHLWVSLIINRTFETKKLFKWNDWYFIGVYIINRTWHGCLEIRNFSSRGEKKNSRVSAANEWNIFQHSKRIFPSPRGHIISSIYTPCLNNGKSVSLLLLFF